MLTQRCGKNEQQNSSSFIYDLSIDPREIFVFWPRLPGRATCSFWHRETDLSRLNHSSRTNINYVLVIIQRHAG